MQTGIHKERHAELYKFLLPVSLCSSTVGGSNVSTGSVDKRFEKKHVEICHITQAYSLSSYKRAQVH